MTADPADTLKYLSGKRVKQISLGCGVLKDFGELSEIRGLEIAEIYVPVLSLSGVENCASLWRLILRGSGLKDLTPILGAPVLRRLEVGDDMRAAAEAVSDYVEVLYK